MAGLSAALLVLAACILSGRASAYYDQATPSLDKVSGMPPSDSETSSYLIPRLAHKYRPDSADWFDVNDPAFYLLTEAENEESMVSVQLYHIVSIILFYLILALRRGSVGASAKHHFPQ